MKDNGFLKVSPWMISKLKLKGAELLCFALIYENAKEGVYEASLTEISAYIGASRPTTVRAINILSKKNLVEKQTTKYKNVRFSSYRIKQNSIDELIK